MESGGLTVIIIIAIVCAIVIGLVCVVVFLQRRRHRLLAVSQKKASSFSPAPPSLVGMCSKCGTINKPTAKYCRVCGYLLSGSSTSPTNAFLPIMPAPYAPPPAYQQPPAQPAYPPPAQQPAQHPAPPPPAAPESHPSPSASYAAPEQYPKTAPAPQPPLSQTDNCRYCGASIRPGAKFCAKCGRSLEKPQTVTASISGPPLPPLHSPSDTTAVGQRTGGVDLQSNTTTVGGDVVGRDKITYVSAPNIGEVERQRRIEATYPAQPMIGKIESLYVQVKMPESPVGPAAQTRTMAMPFKADASTGTAMPTPFRIRVIAPGFRIYGGDEKVLRVLPDEDSAALEFQLQCEAEQAVKIQVEVYAESGFLGQVDLQVKPMVGQQIPLPSERMWIRAVFVLGALPNVSVSTSW
jgi:ribosomal protein L40E